MLKIPTFVISAKPISASFKSVRSQDQDGLEANLDIGGAIHYLCLPQMERYISMTMTNDNVRVKCGEIILYKLIEVLNSNNKI